MTNEEMQRMMEMIINSQEVFAGNMEKAEARMSRLETAFVGLFNIVSTARRKEAQKELAEAQKELAAAQRHTDERLNALINTVERFIAGAQRSATRRDLISTLDLVKNDFDEVDRVFLVPPVARRAALQFYFAGWASFSVLVAQTPGASPSSPRHRPPGMGGVSTGTVRTYTSRRTIGITDPKAPVVFEDVTARTTLTRFKHLSGERGEGLHRRSDIGRRRHFRL